MVIAIWVSVGLFFGWQHHNNVLARGTPDDLHERILGMVASMLVWALFTPLVVYLADRFPLRVPHLGRRLLVLSPLILAIAGARTVCDLWLPPLLEGLPASEVLSSSMMIALFHTHVMFTVIIVAVANFLRLTREEDDRCRNELRFETELTEARLRRLRADLDPHFLFNTLNAVAALVHEDGPAAKRMLDQLGDLLQRSLASHDTREVLLRDELEFVARYLDIQKMRFGDRLSVSINVAGEWLESAGIPPLLLQPLVENAIVHGISQRPNGGHVSLQVDAEGGCLRVQVRDNGFGDPSHVFVRKSIGVPNAQARLEAIYGPGYRVRYYREGDEFVAEVNIPLRKPRQKVAV